jgi:hypothetical protein
MQLIEFFRARPARTAIYAAAGLFFGIAAAAAQDWPSNEGGPSGRDDVTGYLCVTAGCDVVRLPNSNCICTKENPAEQRLSKLKLTCSTKRDGEWVSCPVKSRYGG